MTRVASSSAPSGFRLLIHDDAREWRIDFGFSLATLLGFAVLPLLDEPRRAAWAP